MPSAHDRPLLAPILMDVTCDRCGTEYEFEEALVSTRGTTVKCTHCGHLFKVYKPEAPPEPEAANNPWTVRRSDGSLHRLSSLADLTRLIEDGAFGREDELSRTSKAWKRLGDIEELGVYFARAYASTHVRKRRATGAPTLGVRKAPPVPRPAVTARGNESASRRGETLAGHLAPAPASEPAPPRPQPAEDASAGTEAPATRTRGARDRDAAERQPSARRTSEPAIAERTDLQDSSENEPTTLHIPGELGRELLPDETYEPFARRKSPPLWIWIFVAATFAAVLSTWVLWPVLDKRETPTSAAKPDPAVHFLARADAAFATHRETGFEEAIPEYQKALAFHETDPHLLSSISRVSAVWAQEVLFEAQALTLALGDSPELEQRAQLIALQKRARELGEQAKRHAENAARKNPGNAEAEVALSDALRLTGNLVAARSGLDRALLTESQPNGETLRVAALLAIAEAQNDLRAGLKLASQAIVQDPDSIRARLLLARCLVADADLDGAQFQASMISKRDRSHPGVLAIEQEIARARARHEAASMADATQESTDDSAADAARSGDRHSVEDDDRDKAKAAAGGSETRSHEAYITRGLKLLESGQVAHAKRVFEQALFIQPSSPEAHAGLGFVALEKNRVKLAVEHFLEAKRDGSGEALIGLGEAYRRLNRPRDALRAYQTYVNEHPRGPQLSIARAQVERLSEDASASKK